MLIVVASPVTKRSAAPLTQTIGWVFLKTPLKFLLELLAFLSAYVSLPLVCVNGFSNVEPLKLVKASTQTRCGKINDKFLLALWIALLAGTARGQLFVESWDAGTVGQYLTSGATVNATLLSGLGGPQQLALAGDDLFVTSQGNMLPARPNTGVVGEYTTSGATVNASLISGLNELIGVAVDGNDLFVTTGNTIGEYTTSGATVNASLFSVPDDALSFAIDGCTMSTERLTSSGLKLFSIAMKP